MEMKVHDREIILQSVWKSGNLFSQQLRTVSGKPMEVLYPGFENNDSGPDFKEAVLRIAGVLVRGDIEIHLNVSGWYAHKHDTDSAYNQVILHVISENQEGRHFIAREDGVKVEQVLVALDARTVAAWKQRQAKNSKPGNENLIVSDCPLSQEPAKKIAARISAVSEERFSNKVTQTREELLHDSWNQVIYKKTLEAFGYTKNRVPFRRLAEIVPFELVSAEMQWVPERTAELRCAAFMFGASGLLPVEKIRCDQLAPDVRAYLLPLVDLWAQVQHKYGIRPLRPHDWHFFRLRPQNFPTRRVAGVVPFLMKFYRRGFLDEILRVFDANMEQIARLRTELERLFCQRADEFWRSHYQFDEAVKAGGQKVGELLIGRERARDIILNIVIPALWTHAQDAQDGKLRNVVTELYRAYPKLSENVITRSMKVQLCVTGEELAEGRRAWTQQGLIQLHKVYCRELRCAECVGSTEG